MTRTRQAEAVTLASGLQTRWLRFGASPGQQQISLLGLHMLGLDAESFGEIAKDLPESWLLETFDQRAHGAARDWHPGSFDDFVADARAALERIRSDEVHLIGCSLGGAIAAELAAGDASGKVTSLTLVATPAHGQPIFASRATAARVGSLDSAIETTIDRWFGQLPRDPFEQQVRASIRKMTPAGYDACWRAFAEFTGYEALAESLPPTLCVSFHEDVSTPPNELDEIAELLAAKGTLAERLDLPGAGHAGMLTRSHPLAEAITRFCSTQTNQKPTTR